MALKNPIGTGRVMLIGGGRVQIGLDEEGWTRLWVSTEAGTVALYMDPMETARLLRELEFRSG